MGLRCYILSRCRRGLEGLIHITLHLHFSFRSFRFVVHVLHGELLECHLGAVAARVVAIMISPAVRFISSTSCSESEHRLRKRAALFEWIRAQFIRSTDPLVHESPSPFSITNRKRFGRYDAAMVVDNQVVIIVEVPARA